METADAASLAVWAGVTAAVMLAGGVAYRLATRGGRAAAAPSASSSS